MKQHTYAVITYTLALIAILFTLSACGDHTHIPGPKGDKGDAGAQGEKGDKGDKGDQGLQGLAGIQGIVGPQGIQGIQGPQGMMGLIGPQGIAGIPGAPGTLVSFVKFCTQVTNYPSTFPEYGLCVGGEIFAVYSANGGFGFKTVPGYYSSNAINSACSFTVTANCGIVN